MSAARVPLFVASVFVAVIAVPIAGQQVRSQGRLEVPQSFEWDLDDGIVGKAGEPPGPTFDVWYEAVNDHVRFLVPRNGAALVAMGHEPPGYSACRSAEFSNEKIHLDDLAKGSYVCVRTNKGRYSEFSIDDLYPKPADPKALTLAISWITWEH